MEDKSLPELLKYGIVGVASNLGGYLLFLLITYLGLPPREAMTILYVTSATIAFFGNRKWTFSYSNKFLGPGIRYVICHLCGYVINYVMLLVLADWLGYPYQLIQAVAIIVVAGFLFVAFKYFVFAETRKSPRDRV